MLWWWPFGDGPPSFDGGVYGWGVVLVPALCLLFGCSAALVGGKVL